MASWASIGYSMGLQSIEAAYRSSSAAFEHELANINKKWDKIISVHRANPADTDNDYDYQYSDYISELAFDAETGCRLIREAFALTLYHYWEKETISLLSLRKGDHNKVVNAIKSKGWRDLDEAGMYRLWMIANTIKHSKGGGLYALDPTIFSEEAKQLDPEDYSGWHRYLRLKDEDVKAAIHAVRVSGPNLDWNGAADEAE